MALKVNFCMTYFEYYNNVVFIGTNYKNRGLNFLQAAYDSKNVKLSLIYLELG